MSRESAGAAIRVLREARDWSLADLAAATGVSVMGLSYLERGARKPHKGTIRKVENGLGLPPGTYARLMMAEDSNTELGEVMASLRPEAQPAKSAEPVVVDRHANTDVLEGYAQAQLDALKSVIDRLPPTTSNEYETYIQSVITQCVKAEMLAANSWRVAAGAGAEQASRLMQHLQKLDTLRRDLQARIPGSLGAELDLACSQSALPEAVIATLLGVTMDDMWSMRTSGAVPPGALPRVRAFVAWVDGTSEQFRALPASTHGVELTTGNPRY